jgi:hypothetical protein
MTEAGIASADTTDAGPDGLPAEAVEPRPTGGWQRHAWVLPAC